MKNVFLYFLLITFPFVANAQDNPDAILGKWMTMEGNLKVEVYKQDNDYKARILWFDDSDDKSRPMNEREDTKNPDKALRNRKWIGMEVLNGLQYDADDNDWENGTIYDARSGKEWSSIVWLTKDNLLKAKGYWCFKFLSETKTFKRIPPSQE